MALEQLPRVEPGLPSIVPQGVRAGTPTLEVRWICPGALEPATRAWFGRLSTTNESREDTYLCSPRLVGLSVKIRGGAELDVKVHHGSAGTLDMPGHATGQMESWQKWSFPLGWESWQAGDPAAWKRVRKVRSIGWFGPTGVPLVTTLDGTNLPRCAVELTDIEIEGASWWTLGFEASGPPGELPTALEAAAAVVFDELIPKHGELRLEDSGPYQAWLQRLYPEQ